MLDDPEEKFRELKEKLEDIDARIDELEESEETVEPEEGFLQIHGSSDQFFLHWIDISETSYSECEDVDSVEKAQKAFKEAAEYREDSENDKRGILHGDVMVLLCNSAKEEDQESGEITYTDSCYYAGMCIITDGLMQEENPVSDIKIGASIEEGGEIVKQFIAWDTCGGESCPEDPDTIQFDELKPPESGGGDEDLKGLEIAQPFGSSTLLAKLHELETLTFTKKEDEGGENPEPDPIEYVMFKDGDPFNAGALFEFSNIINEADDGYDVEAGVMQVSLYSASGKIKEVNYKTKTYDLKTVSISSDSCGALKREDAEDENGEPIKESVKFISKVEGSEPTHDLSSLRAEVGSATVSLGTFDLSSLMVTEDNFENGHFFVPKINETGATLEQVCRDIETKSEIQLLKDFKIDVVQTAEGGNCTKITITPSTKKETFTFHSGLLTDKTNDDTWVSGTATSFIVSKCSACPVQFLAGYVPVWGGPSSSLTAVPADVTCQPDGNTFEYPNCSNNYCVFVSTEDENGLGRTWTFTVIPKQSRDGGHSYYSEVNITESDTKMEDGSVSSYMAYLKWERVYNDNGEPAGEVGQDITGLYTLKSATFSVPSGKPEPSYNSNLTLS